jgi:hypothetical protein
MSKADELTELDKQIRALQERWKRITRAMTPEEWIDYRIASARSNLEELEAQRAEVGAEA